MRLIAPVTDYIQGSLLTTQGDLVKHDGSDPARLAIGSANRLLRVNDTPDDLEYAPIGEIFFKEEEAEENAALVNLSGVTLVVSTGALTIETGDRFLCNFTGRYLEGATGGSADIRIAQNTGTAHLDWGLDETNCRCTRNAIASQNCYFSIWGLARAVSGGTGMIAGYINPASAAGATVSTGTADIVVIRLPV